MKKIKKYLWEKKHHFCYFTEAGTVYMKFMSKLGLFFLSLARKCFKEGTGYCSWCGRKNNMDQSASAKGLRCMSHPRVTCDKQP